MKKRIIPLIFVSLLVNAAFSNIAYSENAQPTEKSIEIISNTPNNGVYVVRDQSVISPKLEKEIRTNITKYMAPIKQMKFIIKY